jgi:abortive infection bacteriophage resistance protein
LESRGLGIGDPQTAAHYLQHISYYRLRAYWLPFEKTPENGQEHEFSDGATFENSLELYVFDRELRLLVMDAIERIEVSLRGSWSYCLATKYGPHGYLEPTIYARADHYAKAFAGLLEETERSRDTFVKHYKSKYSEPEHLPVWMAAEIMSLGQLSKWLKNLKHRADRQAVAKSYGLDEKVLVSIAHHLTYVRNICAHHSRLWNKQFTVTMSVPNSPSSLKLAMNQAADRKIYNTLAALAYLMAIVAPGTDWSTRLVEHIKNCDLANPGAMGFPEDWETRTIWK